MTRHRRNDPEDVGGDAPRRAQDHDQPDLEMGRGELHAADLRRCDDVARHADDEQVPETLIEHDLGRHACIGAAEHDRERLLPTDRQRVTRCVRSACSERCVSLSTLAVMLS